jgi:hypothetical protein
VKPVNLYNIFKWNKTPEIKFQKFDPKQYGGGLKIKDLKLLPQLCLGLTF